MLTGKSVLTDNGSHGGCHVNKVIFLELDKVPFPGSQIRLVYITEEDQPEVTLCQKPENGEADKLLPFFSIRDTSFRVLGFPPLFPGSRFRGFREMLSEVVRGEGFSGVCAGGLRNVA